MTEKVRVTVLKSFPLDGRIVGPGEAEVPADKVAKFVSKGVIASPGGAPIKAEDGARAEAAAARVGAALAVARADGEPLPAYLERVADACEARAAKPDAGGGGRIRLAGELPEVFPGRTALKGSGITTFEQLLEVKTKEDLVALKGVGDKTAAEIVEATNLLMAVANKGQ